MQNAKQLVVALIVVAVLAGALVYQTKNGRVGLVEAKSEVDLSVLQPKNPGCSITGPDGSALELSNIKVIPKGAMITGECFGSKKL